MKRYAVLMAAAIAVALAIWGIVADNSTPERTPALHEPAVTGASNLSLWPDPEPTPLHAFSLGPLPGVRGANGHIYAADLARIPGGPQNLLAKPAAASWNTMNLYTRRVMGVSVLSGSGDATNRSFARQVYWRNYWCGQGACYNAAIPGESNHGWARADDLLDCGRSRNAVDTAGGKFGWYHGEAPNECWHVTLYIQSFTRPDPGIDYGHPRLCHGSGGPGQDAWVKWAQGRLKYHGISTSSTGGFMTVGTVHAVERFQKSRGLRAHACTDTRTMVALGGK